MSTNDMILILMRHGIAEDRASFQGRDEERPLTKEGRRKARQVASLLVKRYVPSVLITSPLLRAKQTADVVEAVLPATDQIIRLETVALEPEAAFADWQRFIADNPKIFSDNDEGRRQEKRIVMAFGHEPNLSRLVTSYLGANETSVVMKKAGIAMFDQVENNRARLLALLPPRILINS